LPHNCHDDQDEIDSQEITLVTVDIAIVFTILGVAVLLFVTEWLRVDLVALLVLGALALTGLVTPVEALSGFSNPAVVTVWAVFILSGALSRTGVANMIGRQVLRLAGHGQLRLMVVIMVTAAVMSAFMNNVGVAALLLPVVMDISRRAGHPPSKLLMPLAIGCLLGGLTTLIGTPPNILASDALRDFGLEPFGFFDFAPVGVIVLVTGILFMALVGRHLLPMRDMEREFRGSMSASPGQFFDLQERLSMLYIPEGSLLAGRTLSQSRLGSALGLNVIAIVRAEQTQLSPDLSAILKVGDRLLVVGKIDRLTEMLGREHFLVEEEPVDVDRLISDEIGIFELRLLSRSELVGKTLRELNFRRRFKGIVLAIWRRGSPIRTDLDDLELKVDDLLIVQVGRENIESLREETGTEVIPAEEEKIHTLDERLMLVDLPPDSELIGKTLAESHPAETYGLTVLGIIRGGETKLMPGPDEPLLPEDILLAKGKEETIQALHALRQLEVERDSKPALDGLESAQIGMVEVVLSPHTTLSGKTLRQLHFREKYGLNVLAIWREGTTNRSNLRSMPLRFGDALLLYGERRRMRMLAGEPDFLVLAEEIQEPPREDKALFAALTMLLVVGSVLLGWLPIAIAAVIGATLVVVSGGLRMEEAYRIIDWRAVFLIAGMLPLGVAMQNSGAANFMSQGVVGFVGKYGSLAVVAGIFLLTALASQFMPNPVVTVLMAPIAINTAGQLGISPYAMMMTIAISASASFLSPVGHPANVLIMGPGGYRFTDYLRVGLPLTVVVLIVVLIALPIFWPL
jgi:di/tricarboxylate transporter